MSVRPDKSVPGLVRPDSHLINLGIDFRESSILFYQTILCKIIADKRIEDQTVEIFYIFQ